MKKILGLDLGTNSIGWAVVNAEPQDDAPDRLLGIEAAGSRIIPMDGKQLGQFQSGNTVSATADRTRYRGVRRLYQRQALRRERLLRVLAILDFLPPHYAQALSRYGKFTSEVRLPWTQDEAGKPLFLFQDSYEQMLSEFRQAQPEWLKDGARVPYDWTIYFLRKKALTQALTPYELAWVLLQFNQKRGYRVPRSKQDEFEEKKTDKLVDIQTLKVVSVEQSDKDKKGGYWYDILLSNGMLYRRSFRTRPEWEGMERDFLITTTIDENGQPKKDKEGKIKQSISAPKADDWTLLKKKTERSIRNSGKTVGQYIYDSLLASPKLKIIGSHVRVVDREFYEAELQAILQKQCELLPQLHDRNLYGQCINELYPSNDAYRNSIAGRDFVYLLGQDILMYHRELKSKKSLIDECQYESHTYIDKEGNEKRVGVKCIARSNPLFQEFRLWQFVQNIRIYQKEVTTPEGRLLLDQDVTATMLPDEESRAHVYDVLSQLKEVNQKTFFDKCFGLKSTRKKALDYYWNYAQEDEKTYPCCPTRAAILDGLDKAAIGADFLTDERLAHLWHMLYSIDNRKQMRVALERYARQNQLTEDFVDAFCKIPAFDKDYGSYSAKAINKLLPLMRMGHHWSLEAIDPATRQRIDHIVDGEADESISEQVRNQLKDYTSPEQFRAMPLHLACYAVYGRHSEAADIDRWTSPADIDAFLRKFKQHSLRNPIVEQVVTETLRTVRDIWTAQGHIDEIHIEMGRDLKRTAQQRQEATARISQNETRNQRIRILLSEFANPGMGIEGVRPYSPLQQDILKIYEDGALACLNAEDPDYDFVTSMRSKAQPTPAEVQRYKKWLDKKYRSPYTGQEIPLSRLFTPDYEIEHVIPRSRFFDDSMQNKVICEAAVNKEKGNQLGLEFIRNMGGREVEVANGEKTHIYKEKEYTDFVMKNMAYNRGKMKRMMMDEIPDSFIERQMNDSRYIARYVTALLSNVVRREQNDEGTTSVNVIPTNGSITDTLKKDWGVNAAWSHIILPRFRRLNYMLHTDEYTARSAEGHEIPSMPLDQRQGFNPKRIDHRHHAMDAIVIACTDRRHVQLLNNEAAKSGNATLRQQLSHQLRRYEPAVINGQKRQVPKEFIQPWDNFVPDVERVLAGMVVSFKQNLRVINRTRNKYVRFQDGHRMVATQVKGDQWAIRKPMHKETVFGQVNLQLHKTEPLNKAILHIDRIENKEFRKELKRLTAKGFNARQIPAYLDMDVWSDVNLKAIPVLYYANETKDRYYATRKPLDDSFGADKIRNEVTDTGIQKILLAHLARYDEDPKQAFSPEGIEEMNRNIQELNDGRRHQPIKRVRVYEQANKYPVGQTGNKGKKYVEAAKDTNLFFAIYEHEDMDKKTGEMVRKRSYASIPLIDVINRQKQGLASAPADEQGAEPIFTLSPGDLVYLPTEEERQNGVSLATLQKDRIYKMVSCTGPQCYFFKMSVAAIIVDKTEFQRLNKMERAITGEMVKESCVPIRVDRLGRIIEINGQKV